MLAVSALNAEYAAKGRPVRAAIDINFEVERGKFFTLLGPSGCGKTTTLRSIAGLERPRTGEIAVNGKILFSAARNIFVPLNQRNFGMVFQSYAIWPHMNVFQNAAFPLQVRKVPRKEIERRVGKVLEAVALSDVAGRNATGLSGGQQQRLALARAIVMEPELLLLDEPLSNLDAKLRERMRFELKRMQRELGITTVYVTHDQAEALALSHQIAVMNEGRIVQLGGPRAIYDKPATRFVAEFIGNSNFIAGDVIAADGAANFWHVRSALGEWRAFSEAAFMKGAPVTLSIRPENVELSETPFTDQGNVNLSTGTVEEKIFQGDFTDFKIRAGNIVLLARAHPSLRTPVGDPIHFRVAPEKCAALSND